MTIREHGPAALDALETLGRKYGPAVLEWAFAQFKARRSAAVAHRADAAIDELERAAERRTAALAADGEQGDGQP
jgi:hypothetical protein